MNHQSLNYNPNDLTTSVKLFPNFFNPALLVYSLSKSKAIIYFIVPNCPILKFHYNCTCVQALITNKRPTIIPEQMNEIVQHSTFRSANKYPPSEDQWKKQTFTCLLGRNGTGFILNFKAQHNICFATLPTSTKLSINFARDIIHSSVFSQYEGFIPSLRFDTWIW